MNTHKNARLTFVRRLELVEEVVNAKMSLAQAAFLNQLTVPTAHKWMGRYLSDGQMGLADRSSRPRCNPRAIAQVLLWPSSSCAAVPLSRAHIAASLGVSKKHRGTGVDPCRVVAL
ncbi:MAG: hypothetical protein KIS79_00495 [Burkholderiales bacterium]|nr:hypothetical protein [Burkholderiales bacterium]